MSGGGHVVVDESTTEKNGGGGGGGGMRTMHVVVVCSAVGFLGIIVLILGVAGEAATAQAFVVGSDVDDDTGGIIPATNCVYRTTPALGCGIAAALLALMAAGVATAATLISCACFRTWEAQPTVAKRSIASIVLFAVSWIIVIVVVALFIAGAALNADHERHPNPDLLVCDHAPGSSMFAAATVLSVLATAMQIGSYILLQAPPPPTGSKKQPELAMGQPVQPEHLKDADEEVADRDSVPPPPSAPPLSGDAEPTSQVS